MHYNRLYSFAKIGADNIYVASVKKITLASTLLRLRLCVLGPLVLLCLSGSIWAQTNDLGEAMKVEESPIDTSNDPIMQVLAAEREVLHAELTQYAKTLAILQRRGSYAPTNTSVSNIAMEVARIKRRLIAITEREVNILQERIANAKAREKREQHYGLPGESRIYTYSMEEEERVVAQLLKLITKHYNDLETALALIPSSGEVKKLTPRQRDAQALAKIPFSASKVRLSPADSNTALAQISERLVGEGAKLSRRDSAPICTIRTRLVGRIIFSENRSLKPVGNKHYVARVRLQPGTTEFHIRGRKWKIKIPDDLSAEDYLLTLYAPMMSKAEFHVISIDALLSQKIPYIPAWLPDELNIAPPS